MKQNDGSNERIFRILFIITFVGLIAILCFLFFLQGLNLNANRSPDSIGFSENVYGYQIADNSGRLFVCLNVESSPDSSGYKYLGYVSDGLFDGYGRYSLPSEQYEGNWEKGVKEGYGVLSSNLGTYQGEWKSNMRDGYGVFSWNTGEQYAGEWRKNLMEGKGRLVLPNEGSFSGDFKAGIRQGDGRFVFNNGNSFNGEWMDDKPFSGILTDKNGNEFQLDNGSIRISGWEVSTNQIDVKVSSGNESIVLSTNGQVNISYANGDTYCGYIENGKKNGEGTYSWKNGSSYTGTWMDDKMSGFGKYSFSSTSWLEGKFIDGQPQGDLTYHVSNKDYITTWNNGSCTNIKSK